MKTHVIFAILLLILTFGCNSSLDQPYQEDTLENDLQTIRQQVGDDEADLLAGYLTLQALGDTDFSGQTYREILSEAETWKQNLQTQLAEQEKQEEIARQQAQEKRARLGAILSVSLVDKGYTEYDYQEYLTYTFSFRNMTQKDIRAFTGKIVFQDLFEREISSISLTYDEVIPADSTIQWNAQTDFNPYIDKDVALRNKKLENIKTAWYPQQILFTDGSKLE
jgi:hypothetical protein